MSFGEGDLHVKVDELEALVRHMWTCLQNGGWPCGKCPYYERDCEFEWERAMEELGIEVGE